MFLWMSLSVFVIVYSLYPYNQYNDEPHHSCILQHKDKHTLFYPSTCYSFIKWNFLQSLNHNVKDPLQACFFFWFFWLKLHLPLLPHMQMFFISKDQRQNVSFILSAQEIYGFHTTMSQNPACTYTNSGLNPPSRWRWNSPVVSKTAHASFCTAKWNIIQNAIQVFEMIDWWLWIVVL